MGILRFVKVTKGQKKHSDLSSSKSKREKRERGTRKSTVSWVLVFRERTSSFSLSFYAIRPSAVFGTRRTALRGEGFMWVPDLGSFFKLLEVGVSPYLGFILRLSTMQMFRLIEALNDRLIGPKAWDRIDLIY